MVAYAGEVRKKDSMRPVRADYDEKMKAILDAAADLFAKNGYPMAKMQDIAKACDAKKSALYHYFPTKDDLLFAMCDEHMDRVLAEVEKVATGPGGAEQRFFSLVLAYTQKSAQSRRRHVVAMNDVKYLPRASQLSLRKRQTRLTNVVAELLSELNPELPAFLLKMYTMLLVGMLNWTDIWYRPAGRVKPQELCERIARLFLSGFLAESRGANYGALERFLRDLPHEQTSITLSLKQIEQLVNAKLPDSALDFPQWWANEGDGLLTPQAGAWIKSGFEVETLRQTPPVTWVRFLRRSEAFTQAN
jgi:AcrR family transcriptional regulator